MSEFHDETITFNPKIFNPYGSTQQRVKKNNLSIQQYLDKHGFAVVYIGDMDEAKYSLLSYISKNKSQLCTTTRTKHVDCPGLAQSEAIWKIRTHPFIRYAFSEALQTNDLRVSFDTIKIKNIGNENKNAIQCQSYSHPLLQKIPTIMGIFTFTEMNK